jgi:hypothetical protein
MQMNALNIVYFILLIVSILSYLAALRTGEAYVKMILLYLLLVLSTTLAAIYFTVVARVSNNLFLFHVYTPLEYIILSLLYYNILSDKRSKKAILISIPVLTCLSILFSLFVQKIDSNNSYITIIESTLIIFWALLFFREILLLQHITALEHSPLFWINVGILFYFIGSLIIEGMLDYMIKHSIELARRAYKIGYIFKFLLFILFITGAWFGIFPKRRPANP